MYQDSCFLNTMLALVMWATHSGLPLHFLFKCSRKLR
jgi:hypothetical protein